MRYTREVSDAIENGRPVVALESTIIAHGLPRPENLEIARAIEEIVREEGAVPATIAVVEGMVRIGLDRDALEEIAGSDDVVKCSARDLSRGDGAPRDRRDHRGRHRHARRPRRDRRVRHRRHRRRAPRGARQLGRVGRPDHARADADHGRVRGREVDPRRRGHARAARDAQRHRARLRHGPLPGLLPRRLRLPGAVARRHAGGGRRRRPRTRPSSGSARSWSPTRSRTPLDAELHDRVLTEGLEAASREGDPRQGHHAVPARPLPPRDRRRQPRRPTCGRSCATPRWRRRSPARRHDARRPRRPHGRRGRAGLRPAGARQRHAGARSAVSGGGSAANVAAWAAALGASVSLVCRGRRRRARADRAVDALRGAGVQVHAAIDRRPTDRHLRRARRARRRAHDAARPGRQRRARAAGDPAGRRTCTWSATRCCATARARARWRPSTAPGRRA